MRWLLVIAVYAISTATASDALDEATDQIQPQALSAKREFISDIWLGIMNGDIDPQKINMPEVVLETQSAPEPDDELESQSMVQSAREYVSSIWQGIVNGDIDPNMINQEISPIAHETASPPNLKAHANDALQPMSLDTVHTVNTDIDAVDEPSPSYVQSVRQHVSDIWAAIVNGDIDPRKINLPAPDAVPDTSDALQTELDNVSPSTPITAHANNAMKPMTLESAVSKDDSSSTLTSVRRYFSDIWASIVSGELDPNKVDMPSEAELEPVRAYQSEVLQSALDDLQRSAETDAHIEAEAQDGLVDSARQYISDIWQHVLDGDVDPAKINAHTRTQGQPRPHTTRTNRMTEQEGGSGGLHGHASQMKAEAGKCAWDGQDASDLLACVALSEAQCTLKGCRWIRFSPTTETQTESVQSQVSVSAHASDSMTPMALDKQPVVETSTSMIDSARKYVSDIWQSIVNGDLDPKKVNLAVDSAPESAAPLKTDPIKQEPAERVYVSDLWTRMMESLGAASLREDTIPVDPLPPAAQEDSMPLVQVEEMGECVWFASKDYISTEVDVAECAVFSKADCVSDNCRWITFSSDGYRRAQRVNAVMAMRSVDDVMNMRLSTLDVVLGVALFLTVALAIVQSYRCCMRRTQQRLSRSAPEMDRTPLLDAYHKV